MHVCTYVCMYIRMYVCMYECRYESKASYFFSENIIKIIMKFAYSMSAAITNLRLFFHKIFFLMNTLFPRLPQALYAGRVKLFSEALEFPRSLCFSSPSTATKRHRPRASFRRPKRRKSYGTITGMLGG